MTLMPTIFDDDLPVSFGKVPVGGPGILSQALAKPSFFGQGGTGRNIAGYIGDALSRMAGGPAVFAQAQQQQREQDQELRRFTLARQIQLSDHDRDRTEGQQDWQMQKQWELDHRPAPQDPAPVLIAKAAGLQPGTPEWQAALTAAIPGYGYTAPVMQAKTAAQKEVAGYRADRSAGLKAQPTYAQTHPKASGGSRGGKPVKLPTGFILD